MVATGERKRWILATENMKPGDVLKNSMHLAETPGTSQLIIYWEFNEPIVLEIFTKLFARFYKLTHIFRKIGTCGGRKKFFNVFFLFWPLIVRGKEGDTYPLGSLPVGSLVNCVEQFPGHGGFYARAAGTSAMVCRIVMQDWKNLTWYVNRLW